MIMDHAKLKAIGFEVYCIGKPNGGSGIKASQM